MEENKRFQFTFYNSFYEAIQNLESKEDQADFYNAICNYALNGVEPNFKGLLKMAWELIRPNLESSRKKAEAGKKGGQNKQNESKNDNDNQQELSKVQANEKQNQANCKQIEANEKQSNFCLSENSSKIKDKVKVKDKGKDKEKEKDKEKIKDKCCCVVDFENFENEKISPHTTTTQFPLKFKKINNLDTFKEWWDWWEYETDEEVEKFCKQHNITNDVKLEVYDRIVKYCEKSDRNYDDYRRVYMQSLLNKQQGVINV